MDRNAFPVNRTVWSFVVASCALAPWALLSGCDKSADSSKAAPAADHDHDHKDGDGHTHDEKGEHKDDHKDDHGHGVAVDLGEQAANGMTVKVSRAGELKAGAEATVDVAITGGSAKVSAVRAWIGTQDGKGSLKAKCDREGQGWHSHVEVPSPLPEGSKMWIEIEPETGKKTTLGFDLKA